jgi:tRNA-2-methylthio-N6-dimethylallyladenosine synthase
MVTVIEGCAQHCTFCVVPHTRGPEVSRPAAEILAEVHALVAAGTREVELLGQTINAYRCPDSGRSFAQLLDTVAPTGGLDRLRFVTSHPRFFDDALIETMARHRNVSRYLHLPVQAGSDRTLRRMARRYTRAQYLDLVARIRTVIPDVNLSTDVIVGFPGETEAEFQETLDLLARVRFGQVFGFVYSPRPHTSAARLSDPVPEPESRNRLHRLFELTDSISSELNSALVGRVLPVLIDGASRRSRSDWQGRSEDNRVVNFPRRAGEQVGDIVQVLITRAGAHSLVGEIPAPESTSPP